MTSTTRLALVAVALGAIGCSQAPPKLDPASATSEQKLQAVAKGFSDASSALHHSPKSMDELRPYLERFGPADEILRSPTDNKTFIVYYSTVPTGEAVVACEQDGAGGNRVAVNFKGDIITISDKEFTNLSVTGKAKQQTVNPTTTNLSGTSTLPSNIPAELQGKLKKKD